MHGAEPVNVLRMVADTKVQTDSLGPHIQEERDELIELFTAAMADVAAWHKG